MMHISGLEYVACRIYCSKEMQYWLNCFIPWIPCLHMDSVPSPPVNNICSLPCSCHKTFLQPPAHAYRAPHQLSWDLGKRTKSQLLLIILSHQWKSVPTWWFLSTLIYHCQDSTIRFFFPGMVRPVIHNSYLWQCFLALPQKILIIIIILMIYYVVIETIWSIRN